MKNKGYGVIIGILSILNMSMASAATVHFSSELYPLQVNEQMIEHSLFSKTTELELSPGEYALKLKYSDLFELDYDEHEVVESEPFWVSLKVENEGDYHVNFQRPDSVNAAKQFISQPVASVTTPQNNVYKLAPLTAYSIASQQSRTIPIATAPISKSESKSMPTSQGIAHPDAYSMLEFWWQQANDAQRAAFLEKIKGQ